MSYNPNPTHKPWNETIGDVEATLAQWGATKWGWECPSSGIGGRGRSHWSYYPGTAEEIRVTITFTLRGEERSLHVDKFGCPADNLRALWLGMEQIRLNEKRGLDQVTREFYLALPPPERERDPYEILGVRPDAPLTVMKASYLALAKQYHPDSDNDGGDAKKMAELNSAWDKVKARSVGSP